MLVCLVTYPDGSLHLVHDDQIKGGNVCLREYDKEDEDSYEMVNVPVEIIARYIVIITTNFIPHPFDDTDRMLISTGCREGYHLAYTYSIVIMEYLGGCQVFDSLVIFKECGVGTSQFGMYCYHHFDEVYGKRVKIYDDYRLEREVLDIHNINEILIEHHNKVHSSL